MRHLFLFFLLYATVCSGQQNKEQGMLRDTLKLLDPKHESHSAEDIQMFKNCLVLFHPNYTVVHNDTEHLFLRLDSLAQFLKVNADSIKKNKFYLITDSTTSYSKIISAIDVLMDIKIDDYKIVNYQEYFAPPEPVTIQKPASTTQTINETDSSQFTITILKNALEVKLFNQVTRLKNTKELDDFITNNKENINSNNILIIASSDLLYEKFMPVIEVLKRHEYYKFNLLPK